MPPRPYAHALLVATALAAPALAQEGPAEVARRELIAQAEAAATAGDHARAVRLGERAAQLRVTPTIHYFLAREHLALDHPVEALSYAGSCARAAEADPTVRNRDTVLDACRALAAETGARVGRITVRVAGPAPAGLAVRVQGSELAATLLDVAYPVAPGLVVVEASAPGRRAYRREVQVAAGRSESVELRLEAEEVAPPAPVVVAPPRVVAPPPAAPVRDPSVGPWIVAGAGAASLVVGAVFYGLATGAQDDRTRAQRAGNEADANRFDASYVDSLVSANVAFVVGAVALAGGVTWFVLDRVSRPAPRSVALRWGVAPTARGLSVGLGGSF